MRYEDVKIRPISMARFLVRLGKHFLVALGLIFVSMIVGMVGYEHYESLPWRDAFLNTAMLLSGMGPVDPPHTPHGKMFAGFFALYAGLVFIAVSGVLLAPVGHRVLHHLNFDPGAGRTRK